MSKSQACSFLKLCTLDSTVWSSEFLKKTLKWQDRDMASVMLRFVDLNQKNLSSLGISACVESIAGQPVIRLTTSKFVGAIPIISPMNGKPERDLIVTGRFGENVGDIIALLDKSVKPEYSDEVQLVQDSQITPPIYIECCKFIDLYTIATRTNWQKFINETRIQKQPKSSTLWSEYLSRFASNPLDFSRFQNKCNTLTNDHIEWRQLNYVLQIAIGELESHRVPLKTKASYAANLSRLKISLREKYCSPTERIKTRMSDPPIIQELKLLANTILNNKSNQKRAWRVDCTEVFERFVQYLLSDVARKKGARSINNPHHDIRISKRPSWTLNYLEPDIIIQKGAEQVVIDAKYKSHIFNWDGDSNTLKESFRYDLHQILAYCSLNDISTKKALLMYPFSDFTEHRLTITSPLTRTEAKISIVGIPVERDRIEEVKEELNKIIRFNE